MSEKASRLEAISQAALDRDEHEEHFDERVRKLVKHKPVEKPE